MCGHVRTAYAPPCGSNSTTGKVKRRPWGYHVPTGTKWQEKLDVRLGIKS